MFVYKNIFIGVLSGLLLAFVGVYLTGFTSALVMPTSFYSLIWLWDILVVQFLGFGVLAVIISYMVTHKLKVGFTNSVIVTFIFAQFILIISMGNLSMLYLPNISVMFGSLVIGWFVANRKHA